MTTQTRRSESEIGVENGMTSTLHEQVEWSAVEACRQYLMLIAGREISPSLRAKGGASDLVQETMIIARRKLSTVRCESRAQLQAWLTKILVRKLKNFHRSYFVIQKQNLVREVRYEPGSPYEPLETTTAPLERASSGELKRALLAAIEKLGTRDREVFGWRHEEGCSFLVIGRRLGISEDGGRKAWARAIEKLRHDLEPFSHELS